MVEFITSNTTIFWLAATIIFAIIEAATAGLITIWFAGGSLAALIVAFFTNSLIIQIVVFLVVSVCLLVFTRKIFVEKLETGKAKTNIDALIGKEVIVIKKIEPLTSGQVRINDIEWKAESFDNNQTIEVGSHVIIQAVEGVKVKVKVVS